jgi:hypothetical protein
MRQIHLFRFENGGANECLNGDATATGGGVTFTTPTGDASHLSVHSHKVANFADGGTDMLHKNFNDGIVSPGLATLGFMRVRLVDRDHTIRH